MKVMHTSSPRKRLWGPSGSEGQQPAGLRATEKARRLNDQDAADPLKSASLRFTYQDSTKGRRLDPPDSTCGRLALATDEFGRMIRGRIAGAARESGVGRGLGSVGGGFASQACGYLYWLPCGSGLYLRGVAVRPSPCGPGVRVTIPDAGAHSSACLSPIACLRTHPRARGGRARRHSGQSVSASRAEAAATLALSPCEQWTVATNGCSGEFQLAASMLGRRRPN